MSTENHEIYAVLVSDGERYNPSLDCSCGYSSGRCDNWAEAGERFDEHVATVTVSTQGRAPEQS